MTSGERKIVHVKCATIPNSENGKKFGEKLQYSELVKKLAFVKAITS
jgi:hypothetical protein